MTVGLAIAALIAGRAFADSDRSNELNEAAKILEASDAVRNPGKPFRVTLELTEYISGQPRSQIQLVVFARQNESTRQFNNLVRYAAPRRDLGKMVLLKGPNLWFYDPVSKASVRISPQQRLTGQASQGDVLTVNLGRDYAAKISGEEALQDADRVERTCWRLDLTAATAEAVYRRIEYWVERQTHRPVKGKFYADSGRLLKIAYYHRYENQLGAERPMQVVLIDAVNSKLATTVDYSDYRFQEIPEAWFQRDYLPRLNPE